MRVFVTGTSRCGSVTFYHACRHITNYSVAHESASHPDLPPKAHRLEYPDQHIEIDPMLRIAASLIRKRYPDAFLVHLTRDRTACTASLERLLSPNGTHYVEHWAALYYGKRQEDDRLAVAEYLYDTTHAAIEAASPDMRIPIEDAVEHWPAFCEAIGATGQLEAGGLHLRCRYNARPGG